jgi:hypothetical protein
MKQSVIVWKNNLPVVESREVFPTHDLKTITESIMAEPYDDPLGIFPQYAGMSNGEVILRQLIGRAALGCKDATKELFDRLVGKPKQQIESKKMTMTYQDYLDGLDRETIDIPPSAE